MSPFPSKFSLLFDAEHRPGSLSSPGTNTLVNSESGLSSSPGSPGPSGTPRSAVAPIGKFVPSPREEPKARKHPIRSPQAAPSQRRPADDPKPLKSTLNLPQTAFPMKAGLPVNEPLRLAAVGEIQPLRRDSPRPAGRPRYILHDGPPYANGAIHLGHALNKVLKDFVVKTKTMAGFDSPYVPGWDCHGLPIEIKVDEQLGRKKLEMDPVQVRRACREYAQKYLDLQREQFIRLGIFGRWAALLHHGRRSTRRASPRPSSTSSRTASSTRA